MPLHTPLLDKVKLPSDTRTLSIPELKQLADELRAETIDAVSTTGGHLGSGLGVVELTVALHHVFETPKDILIWDVGHQAYPHKILTGRRDRIRTLRQGGGLSGFTKRSESEYDPFGAAHASTSISAALGFAAARDAKGGDNRVVAVIGDGSLSAGMAYEAMNNAGATKQLTVILNDNDMSIAPPVGAMSAYLAREISGGMYQSIRHLAKSVGSILPKPLKEAGAQAESFTRSMATGGALFEAMDFYYVGPIDGHDLDHLVPILKNVRNITDKPVLLHVVTKKGKGYAPAEAAADKYHGVVKFGHHRPAGQAQAQCAELSERVRPGADQAGRARSDHHGHHRRHARRHRRRHLRQTLPRAHLRCRHRRAARGDLRRGPRRRRDEALLRHLLHLPAARLRPGGARRGDPVAARALRHGPGGPGGRGRRHPRRLL